MEHFERVSEQLCCEGVSGDMIKTKLEYRAQALAFAKKNGFDKVHFRGMIDDFEVYTGDYNETRIVGLPQLIFADGKTEKLKISKEPFKIIHSCKKLPTVVFEYDCICWYGNSYNLKLLEDGRLVRLAYGYSKLGPQDRMCDDEEYILLNSPDLVKEIKKLLKENKEELKKLPREVSNYNILDGAGETFRFGRMKFEGSNALTQSMEGFKERLKQYNAVEMGWEEELLQFQRLFKKFQDKFHEYFEYPLFNGENREEE